MPLFESLTNKNALAIKLAKMGSIPSSEDLKYALAEAKKALKMVELPFKNPNNNYSFMVTVYPPAGVNPPRWIFHREERDGRWVRLWSRETNEVIMIQGKIKIESCYVADDQFVTADRLPAVDVQAIREQEQEQDQHQEQHQEQQQIPSPAKSLKMSDSGSWAAHKPPEAKIELDRAAMDAAFAAMTDPETGLMSRGAFTVQLATWCNHNHNKYVPSALIVFSPPSGLGSDAIKRALGKCFRTYDPLTYLGDGDYACLLYGADAEQAQRLAVELKDQFYLSRSESDAGKFASGIFIINQNRDPACALGGAREAKEMSRSGRLFSLVYPE